MPKSQSHVEGTQTHLHPTPAPTSCCHPFTYLSCVNHSVPPPPRLADNQSLSYSGPESRGRGQVLGLDLSSLSLLSSPTPTPSSLPGGLLAPDRGGSLCGSCIGPLCCVLLSSSEALGSHSVASEVGELGGKRTRGSQGGAPWGLWEVWVTLALPRRCLSPHYC